MDSHHLCRLSRVCSAIETLLEHPDINLNLIDDQRRTPLWWAEHGQHVRVVDLLRKHNRLRKRKRKRRLA
jgi:ankyrin repeat protein